MELDQTTRDHIQSLIASAPVVLFMKGDRGAPQCGFSAQVVQILSGYGVPYATADVLRFPDVRQGIKEYANWPTIPQLYVNGEFVGGCDIIIEMHEAGELGELLEKVTPAEDA